jgi:hypothetical protein
MDRVKKRFRSLNTKLSNGNLIDVKAVGEEGVYNTKTTEYLLDNRHRLSSPLVGTFDWESEA